MSDEQEDIGLSMTINDELRLCGMTGDDEDDVAGDAEELFGRRAAEELYGHTAADPLPVDGTDAPNTGGTIQDAAAVDDGSSSRPNRPSTLHKPTYPVLSTLARDVFSVPVSTISSEATFSTTGRIVEDRRRRLNLKTVEALTCIKDWEAAETRLQHMVEDKELEEAFE
ncbi:unnamed protein product [Miscanthus lutarioriparius]|uniref:HAT C-terminal dimerisation domain-containing protein n=1 Tax=Miscanthus lutarioriparius TaxID=422564 RepID=A0A811R344_9POAL|nr:unnamed protein product [Miscanthus lutarioriparius]